MLVEVEVSDYILRWPTPKVGLTLRKLVASFVVIYCFDESPGLSSYEHFRGGKWKSLGLVPYGENSPLWQSQRQTILELLFRAWYGYILSNSNLNVSLLFQLKSLILDILCRLSYHHVDEHTQLNPYCNPQLHGSEAGSIVSVHKSSSKNAWLVLRRALEMCVFTHSNHPFRWRFMNDCNRTWIFSLDQHVRFHLTQQMDWLERQKGVLCPGCRRTCCFNGIFYLLTW